MRSHLQRSTKSIPRFYESLPSFKLIYEQITGLKLYIAFKAGLACFSKIFWEPGFTRFVKNTLFKPN